MGEEIKFECSACSLCCKNVGKAIKDAQKWIREHKGQKADARTRAVAGFPHKFTATGACVMLGEDGKCKDYENRPPICSVEKSFELFSNARSREEYYEANGKLCNLWIKEAGLPETFLVKEKYT